MIDNNEEQRSVMYEAWKQKEELKHKKCEPHRWSYAKPVHCLDCGKRKMIDIEKLKISLDYVGTGGIDEEN